MEQELKEALSMVMDVEIIDVMSDVFKDMVIAEEEIEKGKQRWPENETLVHDVFPMLMPGEWVRQVMNLYRPHCKEIVDRVGKLEITNKTKKIDLSLGTNVEFLACMKEASLRTPLTGLHTKLYYDIFTRVVGRIPNMPEEVRERIEGVSYEEWPGQAKEEESIIKAQIAQDWRVLERVEGNRWRKKRDPND